MRKNLALWVKEAFVACEAGEEMTEKAGQIFENLVRKFPHVRQEELKVKSRLIAQESQEDIWKTIVAKLEERNRNQDPNAAYKRFRLNPKNQDDDDEHVEHFYIAASQFHKMALKWTDSRTSNPLPLRTITRPEESIEHAEMGKCIDTSETNHYIYAASPFCSLMHLGSLSLLVFLYIIIALHLILIY